ncbi:hypothetical protein DSO57_1032545 [Entomophthora muscae]|uniref:Uncharacterized protein n=1 Tax=Entomophthora muscae TaxID=34485 RepID=A0ACC2UK92_9FUNG|nr:hypothetical protein DSO57_1032545 [Entomophthora muscae]
MVFSGTTPPLFKEEGCCPGNQVELQIKCTTLIANLIQDVDGVVHNYETLEMDLQEMSKLAKSMDNYFSQLIVEVQEFSLKISGVCATAALWALYSPPKSEAKSISKIHVLKSNSQNSSNGSSNAGVDPNYKPSFKQVFDPKTSTIAAFHIIYETVMYQEPDELKKEHILNCIHPTCQETVVPELVNITTWAQIKETLIKKVYWGFVLGSQKGRIYTHFFKEQENSFSFCQLLLYEGPTANH